MDSLTRLTTYGLLGQLFRESVEKKKRSALLLLGALVAHRKESWRAARKEMNGVELSLAEERKELQSIIDFVDEKDFFVDNKFATWLQIGFFYILSDHTKAGGGVDLQGIQSVFRDRLTEIFGEELGGRIFEHRMDIIRELALSGKELFPSKEEIKRFYQEERDNVRAGIGEDEVHGIERRVQRFEPGTKTWLVPCPNPYCHEEKRCDVKTRRYRCSCGINKPYPFE